MMSAVPKEVATVSGFPSEIEVGEHKVREYLLNTEHREGGPKAKFFLAKGFSAADWKALSEVLVLHPADNPIEKEMVTPYGRKITIKCNLRIPNGTAACIRTVWMTEDGITARLVTAYPS
jgi:hypothetical protein